MQSDGLQERPMILAVCRDVRDLDMVIRHVRISRQPSRLASDSPEVQQRARESDLFQEVVFLEEMESIFLAAKDVLLLRDAVNAWLLSVSTESGIHPYLTEWMRWSEGGDSTQRLQDAVLLVNSYLNLLGRNVHEVVITLRRRSSFEDALLLAAAESKGISVTVLQKELFAKLTEWHIFRAEKKIGRRYRTIYVPLVVMSWYRVLRVFVACVRSRWSALNMKSQGRVIGFLVGQNARKHITNATLVMTALEGLREMVPRGLCFEAPSAHASFKHSGLQSVMLEGFVRPSFLLAVIRLRRAVIRRAEKQKSALFTLGTLSHRGVRIGLVLWPFIRLFLSRDLAVRMVCQEALRSYLEREQPLALRTWGENIPELGLIAHEVIHDPTLYRHSARIVIFDYPVGLMAPNPYFSCERIPDRVFVSGELDKAMYASENAPEANVVVTGFGRSTELAEFRKTTSREQSRTTLELRAPSRYSIFYVPSGIVRGYMSAQEHVLVAAALVGLVNRRRDCELLIKPHPTESMTSWYELLRQLGDTGTAVRLIDRTRSPLDCVNAADIVVTKFSTVALEAMELGRPVVSIALDGETAFQKIFEDSVEAFTDRNSFEKFLEGLMDDPERYDAWVKERLRLQREFLPKKMHRPEGSVEAEIVRRLMESIQGE